jgi:Tfp pilus assembly protein PilO
VKRQVPLAALLAPVLLIAAAVGFFLLVKPQMEKSSDLDGQLADLRQQVDTALASQHETDSGETIDVADVFRLTKAMPDSTDIPGVILELNSVASAAGVDFVSIAPGAPVAKEGGYEAVPITLTFQGNYYDLTDFLFRLRNLVVVNDGELEAAGRLFSLDVMDLHEADRGFPQIEAALTVSAYAFATPAATGTAPPATTTTAPASTSSTTTTPTAPSSGDPSALGAG